MIYRSLLAHENSSINSICKVPSTDFYLTGGGNDSIVKLHSLGTETTSSSALPKEHLGSINSICIAGSGNNFASSADSTIVLWDTVKRCKIGRYRSDQTRSSNVIFDTKILKENLLVCGGTGSEVLFFDLRQRNRLLPVFSLKGGNDTLTAIDYDEERDNMIVGCMDGNLRRVDFRKQLMITDPIDKSGLLYAQNCTNERSLAVSEAGSVIVYDENSQEVAAKASLVASSFTFKVTATILKDLYSELEYIVSGSETGGIYVWTLDRKNDSFDLPLHEVLRPPVSSGKMASVLGIVDYLPQTNRLVCSSGNGILHIWDDFL